LVNIDRGGKPNFKLANCYFRSVLCSHLIFQLGLIDQDAFIEALQENRIGGAGLDVMTPEPLPALDGPLIKMNSVGMCTTKYYF